MSERDLVDDEKEVTIKVRCAKNVRIDGCLLNFNIAPTLAEQELIGMLDAERKKNSKLWDELGNVTSERTRFKLHYEQHLLALRRIEDAEKQLEELKVHCADQRCTIVRLRDERDAAYAENAISMYEKNRLDMMNKLQSWPWSVFGKR